MVNNFTPLHLILWLLGLELASWQLILAPRFLENLYTVTLVSNGRALMNEELNRTENIFPNNINCWQLEWRRIVMSVR